ncbi:HlyD family secretion protein [Aquipseudomonas guryensis]|jgi:putative peptide zinc metalloprotease protein|uniref:Efflux RND transporter periplasmic adaptor subunit n=1 Tax=Aquipseudomonas guryensis TaxID=2759165 RepID=A0A7W4DCP4_9GAMM|nr:efflux RND transporter periplasmic adaptor subunit [Pseudomonas guryensis]MBB1520113.1 efflux RND transporter periplasmic adaptor subunit [Pseudomonas guryensis]
MNGTISAKQHSDLGDARKIATPQLLRKGLTVYLRNGKHEPLYVVRDPSSELHWEFETRQFFVLEMLQVDEEFDALAASYERRFAKPFSRDDLQALLANLVDQRLLGLAAASHPLIEPYREQLQADLQRLLEEKVAKFRDKTQAPGASHGAKAAVAAPTPAPRAGASNDGKGADADKLQAGVRGFAGMDDTLQIPVFHLFNPRAMLKAMLEWVEPLKYMVFVLPLLLVMALGIVISNFSLVQNDALVRLSGLGPIGQLLFSLFTVNLLCTLTLALTAQKYRGTVNSLSVALMLGFLPRFMPKISHLIGLTRRERLWLHAGPVLMRATLFSIGTFIWYLTRSSSGSLPTIGLALAVVSAIALLLTLNPLSKSSGYHLIAVLLDEPQLRGKAFKALFGRIKGNAYREANDTALMAYGLASLLYSTLLFVVAVLMVGSWLKLNFSGTGVLICVLLVGYLSVLTYRKFSSANEMYERALQYERWKRRRLPEDVENKINLKPANKLARYTRRALLLSLLICMFLPYPYEPGGSFVILPVEQQQVATDIDGIVTEVLFNGGEEVQAGQVLARLATGDYESQMRIADARIAEEQALVAELKARPRAEEVAVAEQSLQMARTQAQFSLSNHKRHATLLAKGGVSAQQAEQAQRQYEVDMMAIRVSEANLALVKTGATPDSIAAAEAQVQRWRSEREMYQAKIERSQLRAPMSGKLITLLLKQKTGKYLGPGETFAVIEKSEQVFAEIEVPETEIGYVQEGAVLKVKPLAYSDRYFDGKVTQIDANVIEKTGGKYVKVLTVIENAKGELKSGMTGYAKVGSEELPVWKAFTRAIFRFIDVELWSWIP